MIFLVTVTFFRVNEEKKKKDRKLYMQSSGCCVILWEKKKKKPAQRKGENKCIRMIDKMVLFSFCVFIYLQHAGSSVAACRI